MVLDFSDAPHLTRSANVQISQLEIIQSYFLLIIIIILLLTSFSHHHYPVGFHWSLCDNKSHRDPRTLLGILADLNNAAARMVSILLPISNCSNPLGTIPSAPSIIGITVTRKLRCVFSSQTGSKYLTIFSLSLFLLCGPLWSKSTKHVLFVCLFVCLF